MKKSFYIFFVIIIGATLFNIKDAAGITSIVPGYIALPEGTIDVSYPPKNLREYFPSLSAPYKTTQVTAPPAVSVPSGSKTGLPPELSINQSGLLQGTPNQLGNFFFRLFLEDNNGDFETKNFSITISSATAPVPGTPTENPPRIISPASPINGTSGQLLTIAFQATEGAPPYKWNGQGTLPEGLSFGELGGKFNSEGILEGTPAWGGAYQAAIRVTDKDGKSGEKNYSLEIAGPLKPETTGNGTAGARAGDGANGLEVNWPKSPLGTELTKNTDITGLIKYFYDWGISLGGFAAFIALVIAGVQYLTSAGNAGKMSDALGKIRSAVIGLALLLASVLILNTINPQLTQLKPPEITTGIMTITPPKLELKELSLKPCEGALLYPAADFQSTAILLSGPNDEINSPIQVGSIKIKKGGICHVKLFQLKDYGENADYPAVSVSGDTPNIANLGPTSFKSVKLINLYTPPAE